MIRKETVIGLGAAALAVSAAAQDAPSLATCDLAVLAKSELLGAVLFDESSANLGPSARATLSALLDAVKAAGYTRLLVVGHTDEAGSPQDNLALGRRRALVAVSRLTPNAGAVALEPMSCGESLPAIRASGRRHPHNRRVELRGLR